MTTTVEQIVYTAHPARWHEIAEALGLTPFLPPTDDWAEFDGRGVLAVHALPDGREEGAVDLHVLVGDLDVAERALQGREVTRTELEGVGEILLVRAGSGLVVSVSGGARDADRGTVAVQPIWFQDDVAEARGVLEALGLRAGIAADGGGWIELQADGGGSVGVHSASGRAEGEGAGFGLSFLAAGDLEALALRLRAVGVDAHVVDEAYGRSVRFAGPGGVDVCVNGAQDDLYGYHREG